MRKFISSILLVAAFASSSAAFSAAKAAEPPAVKEEKLAAPLGVALNLRMEGPYTAEVPLQVVCYFRYSPEATAQMKGAPVELDQELGGVIAALRERAEFRGDPLETLIFAPPTGSIPAQSLLLIGLGDATNVSLELMEQVGRAALREAARLGAEHVAFAPLLRDQGDASLDVGDVERAVVRGVLLAYDTEKRLQQQGLAKPYTLKAWNVEAGPAFFAATKVGLQQAISDAATAIAQRPATPYRKSK